MEMPDVERGLFKICLVSKLYVDNSRFMLKDTELLTKEYEIRSR